MATTTTPTARPLDPMIDAKNPRRIVESIPLDPAQQKAWDMTRSAMLWNCPMFTHVFYTMMNPRGKSDAAIFTREIPTLATDGTALLINPDYFFKYPLAERIFMVVHEIMHNIFNHCSLMWMFQTRGKVAYPSGKTLDYDHGLMNEAMDLVINAQLIQAKIGTYRKEWLYDPTGKTAGPDDSVIDVYGKLYKQNPPPKKGGGGGGSGKFGQGFDQHLQPGQGQGKDAQDAVNGRNPQEWKNAVAAGVAAAKAQGKMPASLEKLFGELLDPKVPWQDVIQGFFNRKVGSGSYDWRRADRQLIVRGIYAPGRSGFGAGTVVVGFDTSGSIYCVPQLLETFLSEVGGILSEIKPKQLIVVWCDARVHRHDEVDELTDLKGLKPVGGGGTSFVPVFDWIEEQGITPDCLVYMTDGDGRFPSEAPKFPVLWADISNNEKKYPFGDVVQIPNE